MPVVYKVFKTLIMSQIQNKLEKKILKKQNDFMRKLNSYE